MRQSWYQKEIAGILKAKNVAGVDPRHVEGFMRLQYSTLDHLSQETFERETALAVECIKVGGAAEAEALAQSYAL